MINTGMDTLNGSRSWGGLVRSNVEDTDTSQKLVDSTNTVMGFEAVVLRADKEEQQEQPQLQQQNSLIEGQRKRLEQMGQQQQQQQQQQMENRLFESHMGRPEQQQQLQQQHTHLPLEIRRRWEEQPALLNMRPGGGLNPSMPGSYSAAAGATGAPLAATFLAATGNPVLPTFLGATGAPVPATSLAATGNPVLPTFLGATGVPVPTTFLAATGNPVASTLLAATGYAGVASNNFSELDARSWGPFPTPGLEHVLRAGQGGMSRPPSHVPTGVAAHRERQNIPIGRALLPPLSQSLPAMGQPWPVPVYKSHQQPSQGLAANDQSPQNPSQGRSGIVQHTQNPSGGLPVRAQSPLQAPKAFYRPPPTAAPQPPRQAPNSYSAAPTAAPNPVTQPSQAIFHPTDENQRRSFARHCPRCMGRIRRTQQDVGGPAGGGCVNQTCQKCCFHLNQPCEYHGHLAQPSCEYTGEVQHPNFHVTALTGNHPLALSSPSNRAWHQPMDLDSTLHHHHMTVMSTSPGPHHSPQEQQDEQGQKKKLMFVHICQNKGCDTPVAKTVPLFCPRAFCAPCCRSVPGLCKYRGHLHIPYGQTLEDALTTRAILNGQQPVVRVVAAAPVKEQRSRAPPARVVYVELNVNARVSLQLSVEASGCVCLQLSVLESVSVSLSSELPPMPVPVPKGTPGRRPGVSTQRCRNSICAILISRAAATQCFQGMCKDCCSRSKGPRTCSYVGHAYISRADRHVPNQHAPAAPRPAPRPAPVPAALPVRREVALSKREVGSATGLPVVPEKQDRLPQFCSNPSCGKAVAFWAHRYCSNQMCKDCCSLTNTGLPCKYAGHVAQGPRPVPYANAVVDDGDNHDVGSAVARRSRRLESKSNRKVFSPNRRGKHTDTSSDEDEEEEDDFVGPEYQAEVPIGVLLLPAIADDPMFALLGSFGLNEFDAVLLLEGTELAGARALPLDAVCDGASETEAQSSDNNDDDPSDTDDDDDRNVGRVNRNTHRFTKRGVSDSSGDDDERNIARVLCNMRRGTDEDNSTSSEDGESPSRKKKKRAPVPVKKPRAVVRVLVEPRGPIIRKKIEFSSLLETRVFTGTNDLSTMTMTAASQGVRRGWTTCPAGTNFLVQGPSALTFFQERAAQSLQFLQVHLTHSLSTACEEVAGGAVRNGGAAAANAMIGGGSGGGAATAGATAGAACSADAADDDHAAVADVAAAAAAAAALAPFLVQAPAALAFATATPAAATRAVAYTARGGAQQLHVTVLTTRVETLKCRALALSRRGVQRVNGGPPALEARRHAVGVVVRRLPLVAVARRRGIGIGSKPLVFTGSRLPAFAAFSKPGPKTTGALPIRSKGATSSRPSTGRLVGRPLGRISTGRPVGRPPGRPSGRPIGKSTGPFGQTPGSAAAIPACQPSDHFAGLPDSPVARPVGVTGPATGSPEAGSVGRSEGPAGSPVATPVGRPAEPTASPSFPHVADPTGSPTGASGSVEPSGPMDFTVPTDFTVPDFTVSTDFTVPADFVVSTEFAVLTEGTEATEPMAPDAFGMLAEMGKSLAAAMLAGAGKIKVEESWDGRRKRCTSMLMANVEHPYMCHSANCCMPLSKTAYRDCRKHFCKSCCRKDVLGGRCGYVGHQYVSLGEPLPPPAPAEQKRAPRRKPWRRLAGLLGRPERRELGAEGQAMGCGRGGGGEGGGSGAAARHPACSSLEGDDGGPGGLLQQLQMGYVVGGKRQRSEGDLPGLPWIGGDDRCDDDDDDDDDGDGDGLPYSLPDTGGWLGYVPSGSLEGAAADAAPTPSLVESVQAISCPSDENQRRSFARHCPCCMDRIRRTDKDVGVPAGGGCVSLSCQKCCFHLNQRCEYHGHLKQPSCEDIRVVLGGAVAAPASAAPASSLVVASAPSLEQQRKEEEEEAAAASAAPAPSSEQPRKAYAAAASADLSASLPAFSAPAPGGGVRSHNDWLKLKQCERAALASANIPSQPLPAALHLDASASAAFRHPLPRGKKLSAPAAFSDFAAAAAGGEKKLSPAAAAAGGAKKLSPVVAAAAAVTAAAGSGKKLSPAAAAVAAAAAGGEKKLSPAAAAAAAAAGSGKKPSPAAAAVAAAAGGEKELSAAAAGAASTTTGRKVALSAEKGAHAIAEITIAVQEHDRPQSSSKCEQELGSSVGLASLLKAEAVNGVQKVGAEHTAAAGERVLREQKKRSLPVGASGLAQSVAAPVSEDVFPAAKRQHYMA